MLFTSEPWTLKNECVCGHHKDTHHLGKNNCLALSCECVAFQKDGETDPEDTREA